MSPVKKMLEMLSVNGQLQLTQCFIQMALVEEQVNNIHTLGKTK